MKKSELKEIIRAAFLNEEEVSIDTPSVETEDPIDTITLDVPLFIRVMEYSREDSQNDLDLHDFTENALKISKEKGILTMEDYDALVPQESETPTEEPPVEVDEAKEKDTEDTEETPTGDDEVNIDDIDVDTNDSVEPEINSTPETGTETSGDTKTIQDSLQAALEAAKTMGDKKLVDQIGNTITFFTRAHIVKSEESTMEDLQEVKRFKHIAGII